MLNMFVSFPAPILAVLKEACLAIETLTSAKVYTLLEFTIYFTTPLSRRSQAQTCTDRDRSVRVWV